jgi:hypothetical protein
MCTPRTRGIPTTIVLLECDVHMLGVHRIWHAILKPERSSSPSIPGQIPALQGSSPSVPVSHVGLSEVRTSAIYPAPGQHAAQAAAAAMQVAYGSLLAKICTRTYSVDHALAAEACITRRPWNPAGNCSYRDSDVQLQVKASNVQAVCRLLKLAKVASQKSCSEFSASPKESATWEPNS